MSGVGPTSRVRQRIDVVTIFPDYLAPLELSLIGRAREDGLLDLRVHDLREHAFDRHRTVDDTPYGGGAGMVMKPEPWALALAQIAGSGPPPSGDRGPLLVVPGPGGEPFSQSLAYELAEEPWLAFTCGRYEGIDERVYEHAREVWGADRVRIVSLGDYVLNGGEVAVLAMVEAVARLLPGVIGNEASLDEESHTGGLLEYPVYTKPASWRGRDVPPVLLSGDHARIAAWRHEQRLARTAERRPDLLQPSAVMSGESALTLTAAVPGDAAELFTMTRACWLTEAQLNGDLTIPPLVETIDDARAALASGSPWRTWVLRDPSTARLVGSVRGAVRPAAPEGSRLPGPVWEIGRLMVAPDLTGRGLGRALLEHALAVVPSGTRSAMLTVGPRSLRNQRLYKKAGFRVIPGVEGPQGSTERASPQRHGALLMGRLLG